MDTLAVLSTLGMVISSLWLSYTALNLYKGGKPRELYGFYMNTAGLFSLVAVAAWVLMFAFVFSGGFKDAASIALAVFSPFLLPFFIIIAISAASLFLSKSTDKVGFIVVIGTFIWQLSIALTSSYGWAMFALGMGYFLALMTMLVGGSFLGGILGNFYPATEAKMREWLQSPDPDDTYGQANALWRWSAKNNPAQHAINIAQMKQTHFPSSQVVQIFLYSFWSILYAVAAETVGKDPAFFAQISKDPFPFIFGPFFGLIFLFFACIIIYGILVWRKSKQMELKLDKASFAIGEQVTGNIILKLDKPKQARGLKLEFYGVKTTGSGKHSHHEVICQTSIDLSPARMYQRGESIPFSIGVPASVRAYISLSSASSTWEKMAIVDARLEWNVKATLDLPGEIDLAQIADIKITDPNANLQEIAAVAAESKGIRQKMSIIPIAIFLIFIGFFIFQFISIAAQHDATSLSADPLHNSQGDAQVIKGYKMTVDIPRSFTPPPMLAVLDDTIEINGKQYALNASNYVSANPYNDGKSTRIIWVVKVDTKNMTIPDSHKMDIYMDLSLEGGVARASNYRTEK
ncbi:MAG: hypothetical protein NTX79_06600 [Candidatus Micrarchaeota archaeon]|nr:hypothetical protein [Candidatus Micrarchaeota archaeon]